MVVSLDSFAVEVQLWIVPFASPLDLVDHAVAFNLPVGNHSLQAGSCIQLLGIRSIAGGRSAVLLLQGFEAATSQEDISTRPHGEVDLAAGGISGLSG